MHAFICMVCWQHIRYIYYTYEIFSDHFNIVSRALPSLSMRCRFWISCTLCPLNRLQTAFCRLALVNLPSQIKLNQIWSKCCHSESYATLLAVCPSVCGGAACRSAAMETGLHSPLFAVVKDRRSRYLSLATIRALPQAAPQVKWPLPGRCLCDFYNTFLSIIAAGTLLNGKSLRVHQNDFMYSSVGASAAAGVLVS